MDRKLIIERLRSLAGIIDEMADIMEDDWTIKKQTNLHDLLDAVDEFLARDLGEDVEALLTAIEIVEQKEEKIA